MDAVLRAPVWVGYSLCAAAFVLLLLGRSGHRLLLAAIGAGLALLGSHGLTLPAALGKDPREVVLAAGGVAGFLLPGTLRSLLLAAAGAFAGLLFATRLSLPPPVVALPLAAFALLLSWFNERGFQLILPPLAAAAFAAAGAARLLPEVRAQNPQLNGPAPLLVLALVLAVLFVPLALEREVLAQRLWKRLADKREASQRQAADEERRRRVALHQRGKAAG